MRSTLLLATAVVALLSRPVSAQFAIEMNADSSGFVAAGIDAENHAAQYYFPYHLSLNEAFEFAALYPILDQAVTTNGVCSGDEITAGAGWQANVFLGGARGDGSFDYSHLTVRLDADVVPTSYFIDCSNLDPPRGSSVIGTRSQVSLDFDWMDELFSLYGAPIGPVHVQVKAHGGASWPPIGLNEEICGEAQIGTYLELAAPFDLLSRYRGPLAVLGYVGMNADCLGYETVPNLDTVVDLGGDTGPIAIAGYYQGFVQVGAGPRFPVGTPPQGASVSLHWPDQLERFITIDPLTPGVQLVSSSGTVYSSPYIGTVPSEQTSVVLSHLAKPDANTLRFKGTATIPTSPALDLVATGARVLVDSARGAFLDVMLPPGAYAKDSKTGWKSNAKDGKPTTSWSWRSPTGRAGITKVTVAMSRKVPGRLTFSVSGKGGHFAFPTSALPLAASLQLNPSFAVGGQCPQAVFNGSPGGPACVANPRGDKLTCK